MSDLNRDGATGATGGRRTTAGTAGVEVRVGDCRELLRAMPDESVQCVVTSPPYFGLRDYGTGTWVGGDSSCDHSAPAWAEDAGDLERIGEANVLSANSAKERKRSGGVCRVCGARRVDAQIGLESSPAEFVEAMVGVFREVWRVLKKDGTLWLNLGDSYAGSLGAQSRGNTTGEAKSNLQGSTMLEARRIEAYALGQTQTGSLKKTPGLKAKDLIGIPWRVALALQADGWWLRQDIIWAKPNPMPESVRDRCTKAHEYLFLLTKAESYFYDADAIAEPSVTDDLRRPYGSPGANALDLRGSEAQGAGRLRDGQKLTAGKNSAQEEQFSGSRMVEAVARARASGAAHDNPFGLTRNKRSVWTVPSAPFKEAHFATYPPALIRPCILAGSRPGDVVLDPFGGSGTTGMVALELGRSAILMELNPKYAELCRQRCTVTPGLALGFSDSEAAR